MTGPCGTWSCVGTPTTTATVSRRRPGRNTHFRSNRIAVRGRGSLARSGQGRREGRGPGGHAGRRPGPGREGVLPARVGAAAGGAIVAGGRPGTRGGAQPDERGGRARAGRSGRPPVGQGRRGPGDRGRRRLPGGAAGIDRNGSAAPFPKSTSTVS